MFGLLDQPLPVVKDLPSPEGTWELVEVIGEGNYGEVYKAKSLTGGPMAAVKVMDAVLDKEEDIKAELNVFRNHSNHPNIVNFHGAFLKKMAVADDQLWIVMEYCLGGSVTDLAKSMKERGAVIGEEVISYILREVLAGLMYLHSCCVLHRDVKGQNVLLTNTGRVKLIDFGISAVVDSPKGRRRTAIGTPYWMAPEVIACESQLEYDYDSRSDIWSLGITAIEIADSTPPLFGENPMRALFKIPKLGSPTLQNPSSWSDVFNGFIHLCLLKDFEKRPFSKDLIAHSFICNIPSDPRSIRRKLVGLINTHQAVDRSLLTDSLSSASGLESASKLRSLKTLDTVSDLATLEFIDENVIISQLWKRYRKRLIYTYVGDILVSFNPFQKLDLYSDKHSNLYCNSPRSHIPPHIFAIANSAYQSMVHTSRDQCCVVSGESGSGKTEASNILVQQFMKLGCAENHSLEEKILKINPLMESFGNARTVINNNSSRFGKYLELHFTSSGRVVGAHVSEYLLEKSRVISQAKRERNFHIFYYMLAGLATRKLLSKFRLRPGHHKYLEHRGTHKGNIRQDAIYAERFDQIEQSFQLFGFSKMEFNSVLCILAGILNIGDVRLDEQTHPHVGEVSIITNMNRVTDVAALLQIKAETFQSIVMTSNVVTYGEVIVKPNTLEKALDIKDAIAKALYGRLFSWIVNKTNPALGSSNRSDMELRIGILDIFGFENFRKNSFEQLCINVANEQLQFYFNQHIFAWEQEEYEREGIDAMEVSYTDNRPLLELFLSKPMGLLSLLDEESGFPQSSDHSLAAKFHRNFKSSSHYKKPKDGGPTFTVLHYAGAVTYETANFLEKNRDTLKAEVTRMLQKSGNIVVQSLFLASLSRTGSISIAKGKGMVSTENPPSATPLFRRRAPGVERTHRRVGSDSGHTHSHTPLSSSGTITSKRSQTVSTYFINSLRELMAKMLKAQPHFVRCIRPNDMKSPDMFQADKVLLQLRYTGILETTRIRKEGFSHRIPFDDFVKRYKVIAFPLSSDVLDTAKNCRRILELTDLHNWAVGNTKVFLKYYHLEQLIQVLGTFDRHATVLQSIVRGWMARRLAQRLVLLRRQNAAVKIQSWARSVLARRAYVKLQERRTRAAVILQTAVRSWSSRVNFKLLLIRRQRAAIKIQSAVRGWMCWKRYSSVKLVVTRLQSVLRRYLAQKKLKALKAEEEDKKYKRGKVRKESLRLRLHNEAQASLDQMARYMGHGQDSSGDDKGVRHQWQASREKFMRNFSPPRQRRVGLDKVSEEPVKTAAPASPAGNTKKAAGVNKVHRQRPKVFEDYQQGESPVHPIKHAQNPLVSPGRVRHSKFQPSQSTSPPVMKGRRWHRRIGKDIEGEKPETHANWSPDVFIRKELQAIEELPTQLRAQEEASSGTGTGSTHQTRKIFEELISRQREQEKKDSPLLGEKNIGRQRIKVKRPRSHPDSVIHKLLERFDPLIIQ